MRRTLCRLRLLSVMVAVLLSAKFALAADSNSTDDPVLSALQEEMQRSKAHLKLEQMASPYYIDYRVFDIDEKLGEASFGAIRATIHSHLRFARVVVRVGDYKQDSFFGNGEGTVALVPLDNDPVAMRYQIWLATDQAYKAATEALSAKQAKLKEFTIDQPVDDFARADPVHFVGPLVKLEGDPKSWYAALRQATSLYKTDPQLETLEAELRLQAVNRYLVTSEGTVIRSGQTFCQLGLEASTQASDGMRLARSKPYRVTALSQLPSQEEFQRDTAALVASLKAMRDAPVVTEEYRGPVLLSGQSAATVFSHLVGENVLGTKPPLGKPGRTVGAFATSYKSRVLPDFLSVVDDPTVSMMDGRPLIGYYQYDDEGVKAEKVTLIDQGKLVNYVIGRTPIRDFPVSNAHGRARLPSNPPGPSLGNLIITASDPFSPADLKKKLLDLCRQRDLPYCYYVATIDPENNPNVLYRVWTKDGHEELVRGAAFGDLDTRALRNDLVVAGNDAYVGSRLLNVPHSIVSPSILFDELEVKPANKNRDQLPEYPPPPLTPAK
jgi:microcin-processing metallopeptidase PmbA/TldD-like protein